MTHSKDCWATPGAIPAAKILAEGTSIRLTGEDVERGFPEFMNHVRNCAACREDAEGLLAALRGMMEE